MQETTNLLKSDILRVDFLAPSKPNLTSKINQKNYIKGVKICIFTMP